MNKSELKDYKYFRGEKESPFSDYEMNFIWETEKECYENNIPFEERKSLMRDRIKQVKDKIGIIIDYPYSNKEGGK